MFSHEKPPFDSSQPGRPLVDQSLPNASRLFSKATIDRAYLIWIGSAPAVRNYTNTSTYPVCGWRRSLPQYPASALDWCWPQPSDLCWRKWLFQMRVSWSVFIRLKGWTNWVLGNKAETAAAAAAAIKSAAPATATEHPNERSAFVLWFNH